MRSFQQKRGWKNIMYSRPFLILLGVLLIVFGWTVMQLMGKMFTTRENRIVAENKVAQLREEKEKLSSDVAKLNTESGVEESIRDKFGWSKEGEGLIVILEDKDAAKVPEEETGGFFNFFRNWFR